MTHERNWVVDAACRGTDGAMWDTPPHRLGRDRDAIIATARRAFALCAVCPVTADCAAEAERTDVIGVIRAGRAYDSDGRPSTACGHCGQQVVGRSAALALYCSQTCGRQAAYHRARNERLAA